MTRISQQGAGGRPGVVGRLPLRYVLWPAAFPGASRARVPAHALAVLVVLASVCVSFSLFYWADDPQVVHGVGAAAVCLPIPLLLMCATLVGALRGRREAGYALLVAAAWVMSALMAPCAVLLTWLSNDNDYCTANLPVHPLAGSVVPLCLVAALAAGSSAAWIVWTLSRRRAQPAALYVVWLATVAATIVLALAAPLHAAQTCGTAS
ncbi:hypothetical protein [Catenulispora rubra]|uniref:hypothetical protein n=1 Tax=Catenulispora rubra TaxID=280293 RepID=UPI0018921F53|nr:hypothetical protein [Catenulispora rubra]